MEAFASMASSILECLNFTWDANSNNREGMMPVLDTKVWVGAPCRTCGVPTKILIPRTKLPSRKGILKPIVQSKFYRKTVASRTQMITRSAAPAREKIQTATNEFLRRMRNRARTLKKSHLEGVLSDYCCDLLPQELGSHLPRSCL